LFEGLSKDVKDFFAAPLQRIIINL